MKKRNKIIIISILIILLIALFFKINILKNYKSNKNNTSIYKIEGINNKYTPQSISYSEKYNVILQTSYNNNNKASKIYIINFNTGELIKELELLKENNTINNTHVGGIATNNNKVWITSDYEINEYNLEEIINTNNTSIKAISTKKLKNRGDTCTYNNGILWIADFYLYPIYKVPNNKPLLLGYKVTDNIDYNNYNYSVMLPKMVQGVAIKDNKIIISQSYTYLVNSKLRIYEFNINDNTNNYKLDKNNLIKTITIPPMAEGIFYKDNKIYVLFESSSKKYFGAYPKINNLLEYTI